MPSKQSSKSGGGGNKGNNGGKGNGGKSNTSSATASAAASAAPPPASATAASPATAPSFDSLPHATSGERLKGVEVGSTIPALMSELGVLLQQTPGGPGGNISGSAAAGLLPRGQNGGLLFEDVDFANSLNDAAGLGAGDDVSRRFDQIPPKALERLSQVFKLQHRQAQQAQQAAAAAAAAAAAQASVSSKGGSNAGSPSVEAVDSDDDVDAETDGDGTSAGGGGGSSRGTGHTTPAPANAAAPLSYGSNNTNSNSNNSSNPAGVAGGDYEGYSAAGRRHNLEEMFEMMQRSLGNYARGAAAAAAAGGGAAGGGGGMGSGAYFAAGFNSVDAKEKGMGSGAGSGGGALAGEMSLDPSAYSDPLTQLELFRAMMVATSKGRGLAGGLDGKGEDVDLRTRSQRNSAAAAAGGGGSGAAGGGNGVGVGAGPGGGSALSAGGGGVGTGLSVGARGVAGGGLDMQSNNPFQSFLDVLGPQLFGQMRVQPRGGAAAAANKAAAMAAGKDQDGGLTGGGISPAAAAAAAVAAREVDLSPNGAANLSDLQKRVEQVRVLSSSTLEELAADEVSDSTSGNLRDLLLGDGEGGLMAPSAAAAEPELSSAKVGYCLTEAAAVAVSMLWSYLHYLEKGLPQPPGWSREAAQSEFNQLLFRLRQELASHSPANLAEIARCFGGGVMADAEDVYRAINGVGVLLFFTCKPLPLLEKACAELGISLSDSANADSNVMPELIAEKLAAFFYPMKEGKLTFAHLSFIPRVQVHEHAPGNYTCTIDNASNMGRMLRERLISNRFSCNKIKWRAAIVNDNDELQFLVWHRYSTPLSVHVLVRTSEPKKKKRSGSAKDGSAAAAMAAGVGGGGGNNNHNNNGEERETSATEELRATSALFLERQVTAAPGEMIGFTDDFLGLKVALNSPTTLQHGYRTYNKADDRLVFQFSLQLSNLDGTSLDGASANANRAGSKQATPQAQPQDAQNAGNDADPSINGSMAGRTDGGDSKEDAEAELRAVVRVFVDTETAARAVIAETAHLEYRHLQNDECRDAHQSRRRAEERERKALLAKVGPPPELLREVEKLSQAVQAAQQQISKLNKERAKEDKENEKMSEKLAQQQGDLSKLHSTLSSNEKELARLEEETKAAERRIEEKKARLARKEAKRTEQDQWTALKHVLEPTSSSTHHDTLAINDFGSFLQSSSMASATQQQPQQPQQPSLSGSNVYSLSGNIGGGMPPLGGSGGSLSNLNSNNSNNVGGLSAFGTDPFSVRQATTTPPSAAANTTPVFSTQPKMGMATSSSLGTNNNGGVGGGGGGGSVAGGSSHHPLLDSVGGGGGSSSASTHPGMVSPMVPPSPGVASNASAAMGSRNSPASAVAASLGSPGMPLNNNNNNGGMGGRGSASPSSVMMMGGVGAPTMSMNMNNNNNGGGLGPSIGGGGGGGLAFGLAPSLFSTNPVSHASHANMGNNNNNNMGPGGSANNLYTSLDVNAQPFSPSPPPGSPGTASNSNHSHGAGSNHNGMGNNNNNNNGGGGGGFNFTVTAGAGMHPVLGGSPSPLYQAGQGAFSSNGHDLGPHSPSPFSTTSMSTGGNGLFMVNNNNNNSAGNAVGGGGGGNGNGGGMHGGPGDLSHHQGMFPPQPHSPNEMLSFSTSLQWRN